VKGTNDYINIAGDPKSDYCMNFGSPEVASVMSRFDRYKRSRSHKMGKLVKGSTEHVPKEKKLDTKTIGSSLQGSG